MGYTKIAVGFLFLLNPEIAHIVDPFPDVIGWLFLYFGLKKLCELEERIDRARQAAKRLAAVGALKSALSLFIAQYGEIDLLLIVFGFAVVELLLVVPFLRHLFAGMDYIAVRYDAGNLLSRSGAVSAALYIFFFLKNGLAFAVEMIVLASPEYSGEYNYYNSHIDFRGLRAVGMGLAAILVFLAGIVCAVLVIRYFWSYSRKKDLTNRLLIRYNENVTENTALMIRRRTALFCTLCTAGTVFLCDFYISGVSVLPSFLAYAFFAAAAVSLKRLGVPYRSLFWASAAGFAVSLPAYFYRVFHATAFEDGVNYVFYQERSAIPLGAAGAAALILCFSLMIRGAAAVYQRYADQKPKKSGYFLIFSSVPLAFFSFTLYALPQYNPYFTIPGLLYSLLLIWGAGSYMVRIRQETEWNNTD